MQVVQGTTADFGFHTGRWRLFSLLTQAIYSRVSRTEEIRKGYWIGPDFGCWAKTNSHTLLFFINCDFSGLEKRSESLRAKTCVEYFILVAQLRIIMSVFVPDNQNPNLSWNALILFCINNLISWNVMHFLLPQWLTVCVDTVTHSPVCRLYRMLLFRALEKHDMTASSDPTRACVSCRK